MFIIGGLGWLLTQVGRSIYSTLRGWSIGVLRAGPIPRHVAFIMDGNRRFADREHVDRSSGHRMGYHRMLDALEWCMELGITHVSVYAFSVDNFNRSADEVGALMSLAEEKLTGMLSDRDVLTRHGVRVRVVGRLDLLPERVQRASARVMRATEHHTGGTLNICLCYTSRHEMAHSVGLLQQAVREGRLDPSEVSSADLDACLATSGSPPVDLLVRTSGETRLSDFMLRQCGGARLVFLRVLWPDLSFRHFARAVLDYQRAHAKARRLREAIERAVQAGEGSDRARGLGSSTSGRGAGGAAALAPQQRPSAEHVRLALRESGANANNAVRLVDAGPRKRRRQPVDSASELLPSGPAVRGNGGKGAAALPLAAFGPQGLRPASGLGEWYEARVSQWVDGLV